MTELRNLGLSAQAIAHAGCVDHPHDPSDLRRCFDYQRSAGITDVALCRRMAGRSPSWAALMPHWGELRNLLEEEVATRKDGRAPATYARMREVFAAIPSGVNVRSCEWSDLPDPWIRRRQ